ATRCQQSQIPDMPDTHTLLRVLFTVGHTAHRTAYRQHAGPSSWPGPATGLLPVPRPENMDILTSKRSVAVRFVHRVQPRRPEVRGQSRPTPCRDSPLSTPIGPPAATHVPRFAGPATYARLPRIDQVGRADIAVIGVPFDSGVSYRPGARFGPSAVREAGRLLRPYHPGLDLSPFSVAQVVDGGDIAVNPFSIGDAVETIDRETSALMEPGTR